ncbi:MAG TPA: HPr family phosphocarrier protein [Firmicutes bacterium]|nr:HPr family phosphocarrier protein [Bacillota bacterium]
MYSRKVTIQNRTGLHARPASDFIACASKFKSKITIKRVGEEDDANAKSIVMLLSLGLGQGTEVEITAKGEDEVEAVDALVALIETKFGEE